ncbi:MAG: hypothetical protein HQL91_04990 [Magnetococcales bacterium]|nr:hypothetical protein [Magnetococcales bacterium]
MSDEMNENGPEAPQEYPLTAAQLLHGMRLAADIRMPGSDAILAPRYATLTPKLIRQLQRWGFTAILAEPIREKSLIASVEHMTRMFHAIQGIVTDGMGNIEEIAEGLRNRRDQMELERLVRNNLTDLQELFRSDPTEKLLALTRHHNGSARHSIIAGFYMMALGRELGWPETKIVRAAVAVFNHDVGKTKVQLETLNWPGRLNNTQWKDIQYHTLFGGLLLHRHDARPDLNMLVALLHHEWFASVPGKGYGGLTLFKDYLRENLGLDLPALVAALEPDDREIIQAASLVDMVSALEERRSYKRELDAFKVLVIMNADATLGHFDPVHHAAWHRIYRRHNPRLLPLGRRVALPREKERRVFRPLKPRMIIPQPLLTYAELEKLQFLPALQNIGMDVERIRRRGGLLLSVVEQMRIDKRLTFDCSPAAIEAAGIRLIKDRVIPEEQVIELDVWREWLDLKDLERCDLLPVLRGHQFDELLIRRDGGISPARMAKRGMRLPEKKLNRFGINLLKPWVVRLPASENRLTCEDLMKLGVKDAHLAKTGCLERVRSLKNGVPTPWLEARGLKFSASELATCGIDPVRKVFYDIQVTQEIDANSARFMILREGDALKSLQEADEQNELDAIQDHLFNHIGEVVMDFSDLVALPELGHLQPADYWGGTR